VQSIPQQIRSCEAKQYADLMRKEAWALTKSASTITLAWHLWLPVSMIGLTEMLQDMLVLA
jgi:hypothetical protein